MIRTTLAAALASAILAAPPAAAQSTVFPDPTSAPAGKLTIGNQATATPTVSEPTDTGYKIVDAADIFIGTRKYLDKPVLLRRMRCYYADVDDYRCTANGPVLLAVFTATVEPASAREWIEKNCGQLKVAITSEKCVFNTRFVYGADDAKDDVVSGFEQRKVIRPPAGVTMIPTKAIKSER